MVDRSRKIVVRELSCDTGKLYASLPEAIAYLQQIAAQHSDKPDLSLDEHWTGYEDMDMRFTYTGPESDEDYNRRIIQEEYQEKRDREAAEKCAKQKSYEKEQAALKRKYGMS